MTAEEFKNLYNHYFDSIRNYIYYRSGNKDLASDISQETFIKVWKKRSEIKKENIKALLYKISRDEFVSWIRKEKLKKEYVEQSFKFEIEENNDDLHKKIRKLKFLVQNYRKEKYLTMIQIRFLIIKYLIRF